MATPSSPTEFDPPNEPWAADPDAWRSAAPPSDPDAVTSPTAWPQLDAAPLYWMWLERLEQQRGDPA
jgi:hypothetical protein